MPGPRPRMCWASCRCTFVHAQVRFGGLLPGLTTPILDFGSCSGLPGRTEVFFLSTYLLAAAIASKGAKSCGQILFHLKMATNIELCIRLHISRGMECHRFSATQVYGNSCGNKESSQMLVPFITNLPINLDFSGYPVLEILLFHAIKIVEDPYSTLNHHKCMYFELQTSLSCFFGFSQNKFVNSGTSNMRYAPSIKQSIKIVKGLRCQYLWMVEKSPHLSFVSTRYRSFCHYY